MLNLKGEFHPEAHYIYLYSAIYYLLIDTGANLIGGSVECLDMQLQILMNETS